MPTTETDQEHPSLTDAVEPRALTGLDQPLWLQNSTYSAALDRMLINTILTPGVLAIATDLAVTQRAAGANMSVDVAAGRAVVPITDAPFQGSALCRSTAVNNLVISGAPAAGLTRIDLIVARVYDASLIGGSINGWQLDVVAGTPASSAVAPATPASAIVLAEVRVPSGTASITNALVTDRRNPSFNANVGGAWRTYTPVCSGDSGNWSMGNGTCLGKYQYIGAKTVTGQITLIRESGTVPNAGGIKLTLPALAAGQLGQPCIGAAHFFMAPGYFRNGVALLATTSYLWVMGHGSDVNTNCGIVSAAQISAAGNYMQVGFTYEAA